MEELNYPFNLVDNANEDIRKYGKEIQIVRNADDGYYSIDIITNNEKGETQGIYTFAENLFEDELPDFVADAWANVRERERIDSLNPENKEAPEHLYPLLHTRSICSDMLENALLEFVRENGEDCGEYEINNFGLDEGREGEENITKVWNFFDNDGCYFAETEINNEFNIQSVRNDHAGEDDWEIDEAIDEEIENSFDFNAYQCLYIVVDESGNERLKYYRFYNCGACFDDEGSEPDHDYVSRLSLVDLFYLVEAIRKNPEQPH